MDALCKGLLAALRERGPRSAHFSEIQSTTSIRFASAKGASQELCSRLDSGRCNDMPRHVRLQDDDKLLHVGVADGMMS